jgi:hypothetical protein
MWSTPAQSICCGARFGADGPVIEMMTDTPRALKPGWPRRAIPEVPPGRIRRNDARGGLPAAGGCETLHTHHAAGKPVVLLIDEELHPAGRFAVAFQPVRRGILLRARVCTGGIISRPAGQKRGRCEFRAAKRSGQAAGPGDAVRDDGGRRDVRQVRAGGCGSNVSSNSTTFLPPAFADPHPPQPLPQPRLFLRNARSKRQPRYAAAAATIGSVATSCQFAAIVISNPVFAAEFAREFRRMLRSGTSAMRQRRPASSCR